MFKVKAITPSIGAEISGVSLNKDLNSVTMEKIFIKAMEQTKYGY